MALYDKNSIGDKNSSNNNNSNDTDNSQTIENREGAGGGTLQDSHGLICVSFSVKCAGWRLTSPPSGNGGAEVEGAEEEEAAAG